MYAKLLDHLAPDNLPAGEMICDTGIQRTAELRQTTAEELLHLGTRQVVYLKAGTCDGEIFFVICGADGIPVRGPKTWRQRWRWSLSKASSSSLSIEAEAHPCRPRKDAVI